MESIYIAKKDEIVMKLVHYFVTEENYVPIVVNGVKNEVWLENSSGPYNIIRINSNYIHNQEQLSFDIYKTKNVVKQIKNKTLSLKVNTLNILLDVRKEVSLKEEKNISLVKITSVNDIKKNKNLNNVFPRLKNGLIDKNDQLDFIVNVTKDINEKTAKENKIYEETFKKKPIVVTYVLIAISVLSYLLTVFFSFSNSFDILTKFAINPYYIIIKNEWYRLITGTFLHSNIIHLGFNMYALYNIGSEIEQFLGRKKYLLIYLISSIFGSLFSVLITKSWSVGASGAIFGLLGSIVYFGYHYRLFLGNVLKSQIIPIILINFAIGFIIPGIDIAAHFGGFIAGAFATMALGIRGKTTKKEQINGLICLTILLIFLIYLILTKTSVII